MSSVLSLVVCLLLGVAAQAAAAPSITSLSPTSGAVGASVTITGTGFGATKGTSTVKFNGTTAATSSWSATSIVATVPSGATTGNVIVTVSSQNSNGRSFTVLATPTITSLTPTSAGVGASVTIAGSGFGATKGSSTVSFNGTTAATTSWSATSIVATAPAGATTGNVVVNASGVNSNGSAFTVLPRPTITALSTTSGQIADAVVIMGTNFGAMQGASTVKFNGTTATATSWSATSISTTVPTGATTGNIVVTVSGVASAGTPFTVFLPPTISSLSPTSGAPGALITINGTDFQATQGASTVTFGGVAATPTTWNATQVKAPVPAGAPSGDVVVTVGGLASNGKPFTVKPPPTIISTAPMFGAVGVRVTINGTNFGSTQGSSTVKFNGTTATPLTWSANQIVVPVPSGATTGGLVVRTSNVDVAAGTFTVATVSSITVTPANLTLPRESAQRFKAIATNSDGSTQDIATSVTWQSTATAVGTIDGSGVVTAVGQGSTIVRATFGAVVGQTNLAISGKAFTSIGASLAQARYWHSATKLTSGKVLVAGGVAEIGNGNFVVLSSTEIYDPATRQFSAGPSMALPRAGHSATMLSNGKVLLVGGRTPVPGWPDFQQDTSTAELYDPATNTFAATGGLTQPQYGHSATRLQNGKVLVAGGYVDGNYSLPTSEVYDPTTGTFVSGGQSDVAHSGSPGALLGDGSVFFAGGINLFDLYATSVRFNPSVATFAPDTSMPAPQCCHSATVLADGRVLLAGGQTTAQTTASRTYSAVASTFSWTADLAIARTAHTATRLTNGSVLLVGGDGTTYRTAEIFDPTTNSYIGAGATQIPRGTHTATLLDDGTVLVVGGNIDDGSVELYGAGLPTPTSLYITPSSKSLQTGGTQQFTAMDDQGRQRFDATWTLSDPGVAGLTFNANVPTLTALNPGETVLTADVEGIQAHAQITVQPQSLRITPTSVTMLVGETRQFSVEDERGKPSALATWTVSDDTLATLSSGNQPTLLALLPGQVTLTATVLDVQTQIVVNIVAGTALPNGTIIWSTPTLQGFSPAGIIQAVPTDRGPDTVTTYALQKSVDGSQTIVEAFTGDGRLLWRSGARKILGNAMPDAFGGVLIVEACDTEHPMVLSALEKTSGSRLWQFDLAPANTGAGCPTDSPRLAIRHDGVIAVSAPANLLPSFALVDGSSGYVISALSLPMSTLVDATGQTISVPATMGTPIVDNNSTTFVEFATRHVPYPGTTVSSELWLLRLSASGSTNTLQLSSSNDSNLFPGSLMPDGQGGVLATWTIVPPSGPTPTQPHQGAHIVSDSIVASYAMPLAPSELVTAPNGLPMAPWLILGGTGGAFAVYVAPAQPSGQTSTIVAFDVATGTALWSYAPGSRIEFAGYTKPGGLRLVDDQGSHVELDSMGIVQWVLSGVGDASARPSWAGEWVGSAASNGAAMAAFALPELAFGESVWVQKSGTPSESNSSDEFPWLTKLTKVGGPSPHQAIYAALDNVVVRLADTIVAGRLQTNVLDKIAALWPDKPFTSAQVLDYLSGRTKTTTPRFYDGTESKFCQAALAGTPEWLCSGTSVKEEFQAKPKVIAETDRPSKPLLVFWRPKAIILANGGVNIGNEATIIHEALHGLTGLKDEDILTALNHSMFAATCLITLDIQQQVLQGLANLDSTAWACPTPTPEPWNLP
jgi:hypothetical protein